MRILFQKERYLRFKHFAACSTEIFYLIFVNFHNISKGQKLNFIHFASSSKDFA